jgi:hypothetical protein
MQEYLLVSDKLLCIAGCPLFYLIEFQELSTILNKHLAAWENIDCTIAELLQSSPKIKAICDRILAIHNIKSRDIETIEILLFGNSPVLLKINQINNEEKEQQDIFEGEQSIEEFVSNTIVGLVSTQLAKNLEEAIAIAKQYSADTITGWLQARQYQLDPKSRPIMSKSEEKRMLEEMRQEMTDGSFFDGFPFKNG